MLEDFLIELMQQPLQRNQYVNYGIEKIKKIISSSKEQEEKIWLIYLDLLKIQGEEKKFQDISRLYFKTFFKSPPEWIKDEGKKVPKINFLKYQKGVDLTEFLSLQHYYSTLDFSTTDFSSIEDIDLKKIGFILQKTHGCRILGSVNLIKFLQSKIEIENKKEDFLLLLSLLNYLDDEENYNVEALKFLKLFEKTPPDFSPKKIKKDRDSYQLPLLVNKTDVVDITMFIDEQIKKGVKIIKLNAEYCNFLSYSAIEELSKFLILNKSEKNLVIITNCSNLIGFPLSTMGIDNYLLSNF